MPKEEREESFVDATAADRVGAPPAPADLGARPYTKAPPSDFDVQLSGFYAALRRLGSSVPLGRDLRVVFPPWSAIRNRRTAGQIGSVAGGFVVFGV